MQIDKLIPATKFIIDLSFGYTNGFIPLNEYHSISLNYAQFLTQPLTLGMFVPVDDDGEAIELPHSEEYMSRHSMYHNELFAFREAKSKVLFEGFVLEYIFNPGGSFQIIKPDNTQQICIYKAQPNYFIWNFKTVEELSHRCDLQLTPTAKKQIYGR